MDLNLNTAECIIKQKGLTEHIVTNICSGTVQHIPYVFSEYVLSGLMAGFLGVTFVVVFMLAVTFFLD